MPTLSPRIARSLLASEVQREPTLALTGEQRRNRWIVFVNDHATTLTGETFCALIDLVRAPGGSSKVPRNTILRLRKALQPALGRDGAAALIKTVGTDEYQLAIRPKDFKKRVQATRCFIERAAKVLFENDLETIRKRCHILGKKRTEELLG